MNKENKIPKLSIDEKIRLFNGVGNWETYTANGKIPSFFMSDGPHGVRKQSEENYRNINQSQTATCFPTASCIASSWDVESAALLGKAIATEAKAANVNLILGPGMNIKRSPLCGRNFEYFSEDPFLTGVLASSYVKAMQTEGVGSCIKHFACNNQEKRRQTSSSNVDENTLRNIYLKAFEYVVKNAKPAAVMCSYNKLNGTYTCHNRHLLTDILRNEWKYEGVVISDWGACIDSVKCIQSGMDLAMPDSHGHFERQLKKAYEEGNLSEQSLDRASSNVINMINQFQLQRDSDETFVDYSQQHEIALKLAQNSAVLLKNENLLPIKCSENPEILVIGELAKNMKFQGGGSSHINCKRYPDAVESLENAGFKVLYEPGYFSGFCPRKKAEKKNTPLIHQAIKTVLAAVHKNIPILLFLGLTDSFEGEGFDRENLLLPQEQILLATEILKITREVAVISFSGAPIDLSPVQNAKSILHMYLCGQACGQAVANLVSGKVNPSGKLAETWPLKIEDTPCYKNFSLESDEVNYTEQDLVGYRWYNKKNIPVQYEFGHGLSYTTFESTIEGLSPVTNDSADNTIHSTNGKHSVPLEAQSVLIKVQNTGKIEGDQVIQCYKNGELCGFTKVHLEPAQEKTVTIDLSPCTKSVNYQVLANDKGLSPVTSAINQPESSSPTTHAPTKKPAVYTTANSLGDLAKASKRIKCLLATMKFFLKITSHKSYEDPSLRIQISAISENPLESLISTSGGIITEKMAQAIVKMAN